uniref:Uncharacterized protein n=1 Tax=Anguilla anguilla TaxID=7936 RepID=A0A0E9XNT8_ANGAN
MTSDDEDTNKERARAADVLKRSEAMPPRSSSQNIRSNGPQNFAPCILHIVQL